MLHFSKARLLIRIQKLQDEVEESRYKLRHFPLGPKEKQKLQRKILLIEGGIKMILLHLEHGKEI